MELWGVGGSGMMGQLSGEVVDCWGSGVVGYWSVGLVKW